MSDIGFCPIWAVCIWCVCVCICYLCVWAERLFDVSQIQTQAGFSHMCVGRIQMAPQDCTNVTLIMRQQGSVEIQVAGLWCMLLHTHAQMERRGEGKKKKEGGGCESKNTWNITLQTQRHIQKINSLLMMMFFQVHLIHYEAPLSLRQTCRNWWWWRPKYSSTDLH